MDFHCRVGWAPTTTWLVGDVHVNVGNPNVMNTFSVYITMSDIPFQLGDINPVTIINDMTASWTGPSMDGWILNFTTYIDPHEPAYFEKQIYLNGGPVVFDPATSSTTQHYVSHFPYALPPGQTPFADLVPVRSTASRNSIASSRRTLLFILLGRSWVLESVGRQHLSDRMS